MINTNDDNKIDFDLNDIFIIKLNQTDPISLPINPLFVSNSVPYPIYTTGFQHFYHQTKRNFNLNVINKLKDQKQVYEVINPIYPSIDDYEFDLNNISKDFFNIKSNPSQHFFKFWELFSIFNHYILSNPLINVLHTCAYDGASVNSLLQFNKKFNKISKHFVFTIKNFNLLDERLYDENIDMLDPQLLKNPDVVIMDEKYHKTCDINDPSFRKSFRNFIKKNNNPSFDLIIANGIDFGDPNHIQEQVTINIKINELILSLKYQNQGGILILRIYETFTSMTLKLIYLISSFYSHIYICKPMTSKKNSAEKFIVFIDFHPNPSITKSIIKNLKLITRSDNILLDIFPNFDPFLNDDFSRKIKYMIITLANQCFMKLNQMITFILEDNYRGGTYFKARNKQISNTQKWLHHFMNDNIDLNMINNDPIKSIISNNDIYSQQYKNT